MKPETVAGTEYMNKNIKFLRETGLFSLLKDREIPVIMSCLEETHVPQNTVIFREGEPGDRMYLVREGFVTGKTFLKNNIERHVADFPPGSFFGEMSIFERAPRSATCVTVEDCILLSLHEDRLFSLIRTDPLIAIKIMYRMLNITTERLNESNEFLSEMVIWGEQARKRSITDELTDLYNRRFLDELLAQYSVKRMDTQDSISMLMIDIDHFAEINEYYGRSKGDRLLVEIVQHLKSCISENDFLARYGGDEFCLVLPDMKIDKALELSEIIRETIQNIDFSGIIRKSGLSVTVSIGVASFPVNASSIESLLKVSDRALYSAKSQGRNRVVYHDNLR